MYTLKNQYDPLIPNTTKNTTKDNLKHSTKYQQCHFSISQKGQKVWESSQREKTLFKYEKP